MKQTNKIITTSQALNAEMKFDMTMSRYICDSDKSEAVMHNRKTHVVTADGRKWTLASSIVTVANAGIPAATSSEPAKVPTAPTTPAKK